MLFALAALAALAVLAVLAYRRARRVAPVLVEERTEVVVPRVRTTNAALQMVSPAELEPVTRSPAD